MSLVSFLAHSGRIIIMPCLTGSSHRKPIITGRFWGRHVTERTKLRPWLQISPAAAQKRPREGPEAQNTRGSERKSPKTWPKRSYFLVKKRKKTVILVVLWAGVREQNRPVVSPTPPITTKRCCFPAPEPRQKATSCCEMIHYNPSVLIMAKRSSTTGLACGREAPARRRGAKFVSKIMATPF